MAILTDAVLRRALLLSVAGTRGGIARLQTLLLLRERPRNVNELAVSLRVDYKTAEYHARVLTKAGLITSPGKSYNNRHSLAPSLAANGPLLDELAAMWGKAQKAGKR